MESTGRMTQAAYGRARDLSRQRIGQLVKDGRVPLDDDGLVIVEQADVNLATMIDQRKANRGRQIALAGEVQPIQPRASEVPGPGVGGSSTHPEGAGLAADPAGDLELPLGDEPGAREAEVADTGIADTGAADAGSGQRPKAASNSATDYWEQKARREKIEADRAELSYRKSIGELVDADEVARSRFQTAQQVANALLQIPARIAPVVAPNDPLRADLLMTEEIKRVLNELAGDMDQPVSGADAERPEARAA